MITEQQKGATYTICESCKGQGKKSQKLRKKVRLEYQKQLNVFLNSDKKNSPPIKPLPTKIICNICKGSGLKETNSIPKPDTKNFPHISIIGGGIGGAALAVACLHRGIPFTLFERDNNFEARTQGYGLTLQQASKAIQGLGLFSLEDGIVSTRHLMHDTSGNILGEWGMRKWLNSVNQKTPKRTNIHIARQSLRLALLKQLEGKNVIKWNHKLIDFKEEKENIHLDFNVDDNTISTKTDLLVGADGVRSTVRNILIGEETSPLNYLGCIVILGICKISHIKIKNNPLLDGKTIFQTANGNERIYVMPFNSESVMWQLSFPILEEEAKKLSKNGAEALKVEAIKRTKWHSPIPEILTATEKSAVSGYPVYDRKLLKPDQLNKLDKVTLIGDAAHPMSPFKGQGANQALLDALSLARLVTKKCGKNSNWKKNGIRKQILNEFEIEMLNRSATKVKASAQAANFLHSEIVLQKKDKPRGSGI